uniref:Palmitoyltransferase n=1 Tax=Globodera rostochiensis TaxID=31243 RepID=A0A914I5W9_GLORO
MTGGRRIHGKKNCFGRNWCVFDACGIVCATFTWFLLLYGQFCVLCVMMLGSLADDPIHQSINFLLFELLFFLSGAAHLKTMFTDPGAVPKGTLTEEYIAHLEREQQNYGTVLYKCTKCSCLRPERAHHCSVCQRCIRRMDHHCPWVNNCVGEQNQKCFVLFTFYISLLSCQSLYWTIKQFVWCVGNDWHSCSAFTVLFSIFTAVMFGTQLSAICSDQTGIEALQDEYHFLKRMDDEDEQHSSRSSSWKNLQVVFGGGGGQRFSIRWLNPFDVPIHSEKAFEFSVDCASASVGICLCRFENALLAGLVEENWRETAKLDQFLSDLRRRVGGSRSDIREYIVNCLVEMGIEVAKQSFKPVSSSLLKTNSSASRENVYGIFRTLRAIPAESILLAVPMRSSKIEPIAVALAFADYAKKQSYWARDLIFLFVDGGEKVAAEAWFSEYHGHRHPFIQSLDGEARSRLEIHGGQIVGAFALDFSGSLLSHIDVQYSMVNNKLSNLDLVNLCVLLVEKAGSVTSIHGVLQHRGSTDEYDYKKSAETVLRGILAQSMNDVESLASVIGRYGINAVTLSANHAKNNEGKRHSTIIDLEDTKLHHSYLLYVLTSPHRFVSALREWLRMGGADNLASVGPSLVRMVYAPMAALVFYGLQFVLYADPRFPAKALAIPLTLLLPLLISGAFFLVPISSPSANIHFARFVIAIELSLFLGSLSLVHFPLALLLCLILLPQAISTLILSSCNAKWLRIVAFLATHPLSLSLLLLFLASDFRDRPTWHRLSSRIIRWPYISDLFDDEPNCFLR